MDNTRAPSLRKSISPTERPVPLHVRRRASTNYEIPLLFFQRSADHAVLTDAGFTPPHSSKFSSFGGEGFPSSPHKLADVSGTETTFPGIRLRHGGRNMYLICLFIGTILSCVLTMLLAYRATLSEPKILPDDPKRTIAILSTMSTVSAFLLGELIQAIFERLRWVLASRPDGVLLTDFLGMSPATGILGVLATLLWSKNKFDSNPSQGKETGKLRIVQRIIFFCLTAGLRLVVHVEQMTTFSPLVTRPVFSGMSKFNATDTIVHSGPDWIRRQAIQDFILTPFANYRISRPASLINCDDPDCLGLRIHDNIEYARVPPVNWSHGDMVPPYSPTWRTEFDPGHPDWNVFLVENASTIQIEFAPYKSNNTFLDSECHIYGYPYLAIQICLSSLDTNVLIVGTSVCMLRDQADCFTNQTWISPRPIQATLWRQYAAVAYDRRDGHIIQSLALEDTPPMPEAFDIEGLLAIYNVTYGLANFSDSGIRTDTAITTIRYHAVEQATAWLKGNVGTRGAAGDQDHFWSSLAGRALLLWPLTDFTNPLSPADCTTGASARQFYRLSIQSSSVYGFLFIVLTILTWSAYTLWSLSTGAMAPNSSLFPEIDFASKCVQFKDERSGNGNPDPNSGPDPVTGMNLLIPLSNAESKGIINHLSGVTIYAGSAKKFGMNPPHVSLTTKREEVDELTC